MKQYVEKGGNLLVMMSEGGENSFKTNINFLLEDFGIMVNTGKYRAWKISLLINTVAPRREILLLHRNATLSHFGWAISNSSHLLNLKGIAHLNLHVS